MDDADVDSTLAFMERLIALDMALTGRGDADARGAYYEQITKAAGPERFLREMEGCREAYYLSDRGLSRLYCEGASLRLSPSSSAQVKARWEECREERAAVEELLSAVAPEGKGGVRVKELTPTQHAIMQAIRDGAKLRRGYDWGHATGPLLDHTPAPASAVAALVRKGFFRDPVIDREYEILEAGRAYLETLEPTPPPVYGRPRPV